MQFVFLFLSFCVLIFDGTGAADCEQEIITSPANTVGIFRISNCGVSGLKEALENVNSTYDRLEIIGSDLEKLEDNIFSSVPHIISLSLSKNEIKEISKDAFQGLENLKFLYLDNNEIFRIFPGTFDHLENLEVLDLSGNKLQILDKEIFARNLNLKRINLNDNRLMILEDSIFSKNNTKLEQLLINNNKITAVAPKVFEDLQELKRIELQKNICIDDVITSPGKIRSSLKICMNFFSYKGEILNRANRSNNKSGASLKLVSEKTSEEILVSGHSSWTLPLLLLFMASFMINALFGYNYFKDRNRNYRETATEAVEPPPLAPHHFVEGEDIELAELESRESR